MSGFDPESAGVSFDPEQAGVAFNPEFAGNEIPAQQRLDFLSNRILSGQSNAQDENAYKQAYVDYHQQNPTLNRVGSALASFDPTTIGMGVANIAKDLYQWHQDINKGPDQGAITAKGLGAISQGVKTGAADTASFMLSNLPMSAMEEIGNVMADISKNPQAQKEYLNESADIALKKLYHQRNLAPKMENPYQAGTPEHAQFEGGRFVGSMAVPAPAIPGLSKAMQAVGNVAQNVATRTAGVAMMAVPAVSQTVIGAGKIGAAVAMPKLAAARVGWSIVRGMAKDTPGELSAFAQGNALQKGFFNAVGEAGKTVATTPVGIAVLDHIAETGPQIAQKLQTDIIDSNFKIDALKAQLKDAVNNGLPQGDIKKQIKREARNNALIEAKQNFTQTGLDAVNWLRARGASGVSSKLADSITGALQGSAAMYALNSFSGQPGQVDNDAAAQGAIYGGFLGSLGASLHKTQATDLRKTANAKAIYKHPTLKTPLEGFGAKPSENQPAPESHAVIGGIPVSENKLADTLKTVTQSAAEATAQSSGHTYDLTQKKARGSEQYNFEKVPDTHLKQIAQMAVPIESSWIEKAAYDPNRQIAMFKLLDENGRRGGVSTYALPGMTPEKFQAFMQGLNQARMVEANVKGSQGKYFNDYIKKYENTFRIKDGVWNAKPQTPPAQ